MDQKKDALLAKARLSFSFFLCLSFLAFFAAPTRAEDVSYYVPPSQMSAALQVMDLGYSNIFGLFQSGTGGFSFNAETNTISKIKLAIEAASLTVPNADAAGDLAALFEPRSYPEISFMATAPATFQDGRAEIKGTLTVRGQSKPATFEGTLNNASKGKNAAIGLSLRGAFKRAEFAMGDPPEIPGRFGDTITLMLEMRAIRP